VSLLQAPLLGTYWGSPKGVTTYSNELHDLWQLNYLLSLPVSAIVLGAIVWCVVRYRKRPGETRIPRQFQYHIPIEATYTIIPLMLVAVIFGYMYGIENNETNLVKNPAMVINVQGFQWGWRFTYPDGFQELGSVASQPSINDEAALPVLTLPTDETIQLNLRSDDVLHTFYVPEFLYNRDVFPGIRNNIDVNITTAGEWIGECNNFCGTYHAFMRFEVKAMPAPEFNAWYKAQKPDSITIAGASNS
jgi:cytochrome c oxidase subunit 2